jgi:hypothetical protein
MSSSAIYRGKPRAGSADLASRHRASGRPALRHLTVLAGAAGLMVLASACAGPSQHAGAAVARPRHTAVVAVAASRRAVAPAASRPAAGAGQRVHAPAASRPGPAAAAVPGAPAAGYAGPHFTTPQAAMTYLAHAYNRDDTAALHAVTDPQAFTALMSMRSSDTGLRLRSCTQNPHGDYTCSFRYGHPAGRPGPRHGTTMIIAAPARNPGWYMYRFIEGCN